MAKNVYDSVIELQVINYLFQTNSLQSIILNGIDSDYFTTYKEHFDFIKNYYDKYSQLPSKETFQAKFNDNFDWVNITDPEDYLFSKLKEAKLYRDLIKDFNSIGNLLKEEKSDKAVDLMAELSQKYLKQKTGKCIDLISDASLRLEEYKEKVKNPNQAFITTGIKELDDILGGWDLKNESAVIAARTGFGKSWWLIFFALQAAKQGLRVGYYSGEMEPDLVGYRLDTFQGNLPNGSLTHGNEQIYEQYEDYIESLNKVVPGHIFCSTPDDFGGMATVSKIRAFIEKYDIQFMCIDQLSLMDDERKAKNPIEQAGNISKDLRTLQRLKKIPFLMASQLNRQENEEGPSTRNISQNDRIGCDATTILFIERKNDNVIFTVGKARNAKTGDKLTYIWNINKGILNYIPTEGDAKGGSEVEAVENQYNDKDKSNNVF